ncbi:GerAB/ArcD/ProY family transporter [Paenibacillus arenilitoris]|uniref:Endospore germination permease n=1 Tax=Paenibacillus arenilitoris TaxID=2772299 RepID=A0A927H527_9BACL|nr:endospore germination permease [Paenibacillus arenilitoris]MBD2867992.1 endospore germination permease [Paenibacillus arenilitoris]
MLSNEKISGAQISLLFFTFIVSTLILSVPGIMVSFAKQNAWMSIIPASLTGIVNIYVMTALARRYPGQSIMQYATAICGKWAGKLVGFYCTYYLFFFISSTVNEHAGFLNTNLLLYTPPLVLMATMLLLCGFAVLAGVETIGRCNEVIVLIVLVLLIPIFIFSLRDADPARLTPMLGEGLVPVIRGSVVPSAWMSQFYFLGWFLPHLKEKPEKVRKKLLAALGGIVALIMVVDLLGIMVFGPITPRMKFAFLDVIKYTSIIGPLERLEAIAVTIWILGIFVKISMLLYMFCISATQLFGAKNYRKSVLPITVLSAVGSVWIFKNAAEFEAWITFTFPILALFTQSLLPLLLLAVAVIKAKIVKH